MYIKLGNINVDTFVTQIFVVCTAMLTSQWYEKLIQMSDNMDKCNYMKRAQSMKCLFYCGYKTCTSMIHVPGWLIIYLNLPNNHNKNLVKLTLAYGQHRKLTPLSLIILIALQLFIRGVECYNVTQFQPNRLRPIFHSFYAVFFVCYMLILHL